MEEKVPTFRPEDLRTFSTVVLEAAGAPPEEAALVALHAVASLLSGEENHGMDLGTQYIALIEQGLLKPGAAMTIVRETETTLMVDGNFNFGHVVSHRTMERLIAKARSMHVAAASIRNQTHVGRLIDYTSMAAEHGMIGLMMTDGAWGPKLMAPHGGRDRRLGVNPWSIALPSDLGGTFGFDMTSGTVSVMKIRRAKEEGRHVPEGWILDAAGRPTTDPADFFDGGSVLPLGGAHAHKGYALTFMIEVLADVLSGMDFRADASRDWPIIDGCFMAVFDVSAFRALDDFKRDLGEMVDYVKSSAPAEGSTGVYFPGERSERTRRERQESGVEITEHAWASIMAIADRLGVGHLAPVARQ